MKNQILSLTFAIFLLFLFDCAFSQDYDLIVTEKGDSIACRIDSIDDTHIYYEMKSQGSWIHTFISKSGVSEYKRNAINKSQYNFKAGTSIIESMKPVGPVTIRDIQKNSVYVGILSLNYARMIPIADNVGITFGGGLYHFDATGVVGESTVLAGGVKHFFESGIMGVYLFGSEYDPDIQEEEPNGGAASFRIGYRYQGKGGLLLRAAPNFIYFDQDFFLWYALSIGYSF